MSKAEDRALEAFPLKIDGDSRGFYDLNVIKRIVYQQGYEQAEKDVALTWEDINRIEIIIKDVYKDYSHGIEVKQFGMEVLNRFNKHKEDGRI